LAHGFDVKRVVHPSQIEAVNDVFTPSAEELLARSPAALG